MNKHTDEKKGIFKNIRNLLYKQLQQITTDFIAKDILIEIQKNVDTDKFTTIEDSVFKHLHTNDYCFNSINCDFRQVYVFFSF